MTGDANDGGDDVGDGNDDDGDDDDSDWWASLSSIYLFM